MNQTCTHKVAKKIWFRKMTSLEPYEFYSASIDFLFSLPHYTSGLPVIRLLYHYYIICLPLVGLYPGTKKSQINPLSSMIRAFWLHVFNVKYFQRIKICIIISNVIFRLAIFCYEMRHLGKIMRYRYNIFNF